MMRKFALVILLMLNCGVLRAITPVTCTFTVTSLSFGNYTGATLDGAATVTITCPRGGQWQIPMYTGSGVGATETTRYMTSFGGAELAYQLYTDATRTTNWGNTTNNEEAGSGSGSVTVYGVIPAGQNVAPGTYTDTMTTINASYTVTAVIQPACTISATTLAFGTYSGSLINATNTLTVICTSGTSYNIGLNAGTSTGATVTTRKMTGPGSATLSYSMFRDSANTLNWGNSVGTDTLQGTGTGSAVQHNVYGQLPAGQYVTAGAYTDTIVATVTY